MQQMSPAAKTSGVFVLSRVVWTLTNPSASRERLVSRSHAWGDACVHQMASSKTTCCPLEQVSTCPPSSVVSTFSTSQLYFTLIPFSTRMRSIILRTALHTQVQGPHRVGQTDMRTQYIYYTGYFLSSLTCCGWP